jgi:hypothetical protein
MSITIYIPYFYIIQHINSGKYYAGAKFAKNANPDNLLKSNGYKTSSNIVKQIIIEEGLESFIIRKIKVFETADQALNYESRFLRKVNAAFNESFLNRSNNSINSFNKDLEKLKRTNLEKFGFEHSFQSPEVREKSRQTNLKKRGCDWVVQSLEFKEKSKQTCLDKYGFEFPNQSPELKEKYKQTCLDKYGHENVSQSPEIKEKKKQTCLEKYDCENPYQSEEVKEKIKRHNLDKYGVENVSQSPEIKEKKKLKYDALMNSTVIVEIRKYKDEFKLKLGCNWYHKNKEILDDILKELKKSYGELPDLAKILAEQNLLKPLDISKNL